MGWGGRCSLLVSLTLESAAGKAVMAEGSLLTPWHQIAEVLKFKVMQNHLGSMFIK